MNVVSGKKFSIRSKADQLKNYSSGELLNGIIEYNFKLHSFEGDRCGTCSKIYHVQGKGASTSDKVNRQCSALDYNNNC